MSNHVVRRMFFIQFGAPQAHGTRDDKNVAEAQVRSTAKKSVTFG
jgi:hypothetical protein